MKYVTTDLDLFNAADGSYFFVAKGKVKLLPEIITPIIKYALDSKQLREPTEIEMQEYLFEQGLELALRDKKIINANDYKKNVENYKQYLEECKSIKPEPIKQEQPKPEIKKEIIDKKN